MKFPKEWSEYIEKNKKWLKNYFKKGDTDEKICDENN